MSDLTKDQIEDLAKRLDTFADGDVHEARRDALLGMHPEQNDYETWAGMMTQAASAIRQLMNEQKKQEKLVSDQRYRIQELEDEWSHTDLDRIRLLRNDADLNKMERGQLLETVVRLQEKYRYADLDGCVVGYVRDAAKKTFAGNCTFVDDDLHLITVCARWALLNGIPDEMNPEIIPKAKAHLAALPLPSPPETSDV